MVAPDSNPNLTALDSPNLLQDLVDSSLLSPHDRNKALKSEEFIQHPKTNPLELLASLSLQNLSEPSKTLDIEQLFSWLASRVGQPFFIIDPLKIDVTFVTSVMSHAYAKRHEILAVAAVNNSIVIASAQPWNQSWEESLQHANGKDIKRVIANPIDIRRYTEEFYQLSQSVDGALGSKNSASDTSNFEQLLELGANKTSEANDQHIANIVEWLLRYAFEQRASDIHIEPRREHCYLRFRIDGVLHHIYEMPPAVASAMISRLKILGRMNLAEKRKPQDGRLKTLTTDGQETELRLSTVPTAFGEKLVMRIFDPKVLVQSLFDLGFSTVDKQRWRSMSKRTHGLILITGPTGSGKTTSLYSTLKYLATQEVNVCTIEDPIEMIEPSFNQMQVQHNIDLNFATGLRALLRQDPDIIMVGEIRDSETAEMAIQAALTGHLVLSTMHTNDAPSAILRMRELNIPAYLLRSCLLGVMAQRLVRTLCSSCKNEIILNEKEWTKLISPSFLEFPKQVFEATGCSNCRNTGYNGRVGLFEIMLLEGDLLNFINENVNINDLRQQAIKQGMRSLRLSGAEKIAKSLTSVEEVLRVTSDQFQS
ncbi:MAG: GspE/PulE family protein [Candidatus Endonucleobacter sp. (ex Gigantidas childressi)]|nr:GspE/PulE family protein [Candidatus Endonucleobacter sp. (ex Gigantidas childressi)]